MLPCVKGATAIVLAAGAGVRLGARQEKAFLQIGGRSIMEISAAVAAASPLVDSLVITVTEASLGRARETVSGLQKPFELVIGGVTRQDSVQVALAAIPQDVETIVVHDAARPLASSDLFGSVVGALIEGVDGAVPALVATDTVKRISEGFVVATEDRATLALAQTPQAFRATALRDSHARLAAAGLDLTDDAAALEWAGYRVRVIAGEAANIKITTAPDLVTAEAWMRATGAAAPSRAVRVGSGFDVHTFEPGRPLWLAGVLFEGETGLAGHSDGDAVCHAAADALLGAAGLGDVGEHFPDTDPDIAGISGADLLSRAARSVRDAGWLPTSLDLTVICEKPAIAPRRQEMRLALATAAGLSVEQVSVKATRPEGLGLQADGVGCLAIAVLG
jgi:2-C-methyl-D-erythritol 4-phosphate cytidylyltransferase/2-C-methyl-D-erythritol 2,4-cyclodiphosphate synthase